MRTGLKSALGLALIGIFFALTACGGGGSSSSTTQQNNATLSYPSGTQSFVVNTAISGVKPTITGTLTNFSVNPALPAGLTLDPNTGVIGGTPASVTATANYTISASGTGGAGTSAILSITVTAVPPSNVSYGATSLTLSAGVGSSTLTPTNAGGPVVSWSISPALPEGLSFSATDGSISGVPTVPSAAAQYVVTAQNSGGQLTVALTIAVNAAPLITLGHQASVLQIRSTATTVLSIDSYSTWILWNYSTAALIASGNSSCSPAIDQTCALVGTVGAGPQSLLADVAGTTAVLVTPTGLEVHSTADGNTSGSIVTSGTWWRLATDGSYIATGSSSGLSAWSPSGQLLFSHAGDYSKAFAFAAPGQVLVGAGAAGANVVETIAVPSGTATTGPQFNGAFSSWFTDGGSFITMVGGSTALIYSNAGTQQGILTTSTAPVGQGNWVWTSSSSGTVLNVYPATGTSQVAAATYTFSSGAGLFASGLTIGVFPGASGSAASVVDLSGTSPSKTDYTSTIAVGGPYTAVSASQWLASDGFRLIDGASLASTPRAFGYGEVLDIAGGTGHFAVATSGGNILYFNSTTLALEGTIPFSASRLALSGDGTLLVAARPGTGSSEHDVRIYQLPAGGSPIYTWPYDSTNGATTPEDVELSSSGTVLGQVLSIANTQGYTLEASAPTGGSQVFSAVAVAPSGTVQVQPPPLRISPDGTLVAYSQTDSPLEGAELPTDAGTTLLQNGALVGVFNGLTVGWLDDSRLVVNNYGTGTGRLPGNIYTGCTLYGPNGVATGSACALPYEVLQFQPVTTDGIYVPGKNQILSVSTGGVTWMSGDPNLSVPFSGNGGPLGAIAGSYAIFVSGINLLVQTF